MRGVKCHKLDWQATATSEHIGLSMSFKDFEQSQRFVALLIKFIQDGREPCDALPDIAWYCPPALQQTPGA